MAGSLKISRVWGLMAGLSLLLASCEPMAFPAPPTSPPTATIASDTRLPAASATLPPRASATPTAPATAAQHSAPLAITRLAPEQAGLFELIELDLQSELTPANPFDSQELDIRVEFTAPSGRVTDVGAFWYQAYDSTGKRREGEPGWKARFTPTETGEWRAVARIPASGLESAPARFSVVESDRHGFVRINPSNPRYFAFDDGSFFFPIGLNMAWWPGASDVLPDYKRWMDLFSSNGGNTIRVWMADWSFGLEWNDTPLGDYTNRLQRAWYLDQVFNMAEEREMYILLVLLNCADFNDWQTDGWNHNPYNQANGGPLESPDKYVTDPQARALLERRMDYITRRWGYSPNLLAWEWWNEVNLAPFSDETLIPWLQEMTATLKAQDPNQHLVTNSFAISDTSPIWSLPEMEIIQKHEYALQEQSPVKDLAERVAADFATLVEGAAPKPALMGEFGYGDEGWGEEADKTGIHLHNGIWATTFAGYAGSGMFWWWDVYVEKYQAWHHFRGLERFLEDVDLSRYQPFSPLDIRSAEGGAAQAVGLGLRGEDVLVWLRSNAYTVQAKEAAYQAAGSPASFIYRPGLVEGQVLTLREMQEGTYTVRWFDPQQASWLEAAEVSMQDGQLTIPIPAFMRDLAARIVFEP